MKKTKYSKWQLHWQLFMFFENIFFLVLVVVIPLIKNEVVSKKRWIHRGPVQKDKGTNNNLLAIDATEISVERIKKN
ncbi:hypothetical protein [Spiroplasma endosymbiont of Agriotes lineatus]|uniref:hypothetical protein n=1 Tax=Spiroplasma endosymbiont of Agriotes lineatus TaxID=3077930 RepID=UPI0030CF755A